MRSSRNKETGDRRLAKISPTKDRDPVRALPGVGPFTARALSAIGVETVGTLRKLGAVETYARLRFAHGKGVNLNMLYGLDAALSGIDWRAISPSRKAALLAAYRKRSPNDV